MKPLKGLKVVFMGTPRFSVPSLSALIDAECSIAGVVTQPDRPVGRGRKLAPPPVKEAALKEGLPVYQPRKILNSNFIEELKLLSPDVIVVVAFGQILPESVLDLPPMGCINVHASLLPAYRGASPINRAVINGEKSTGITTMLMDKGLDTGDMLLKKKVPIKTEDDSESLSRALADEGAGLLLETLKRLKKASLRPVPQDDAAASYAPTMKKEDGMIDWSKSPEDIVNLVRGTLPWPVAHTALQGKILKIYRAERTSSQGKPGTVICAEGDCIEVAAGLGSISVLELQLEGKRRMKASEFLRGFPLKTGEMLGS